jgi:hypothetical protein
MYRFSALKIILHVGLPKTGTTFLQQQIAFYRDALAVDGVYVPQTATFRWVRLLTGDSVSDRMACEENNHLMLAWALQPERWPQFPASVQRLLPEVWDLLLKELTDCGAPYCLITAENLSWDLSKESQFQAIRDSLAGHDVTVVCCLRQLHEFIASMYGHLLALDRGPYLIDDFVAEFYPKWERDFQAEIWQKTLGSGCFREVAYEAIAGPDILQRFLAAAIPGHPSSLRSYPVMPGTNPHRSFSPCFQRFLEELHANAIGSARFKELYRSLPDSYRPLEHRAISPAEIDAALERHRAGGSPAP